VNRVVKILVSKPQIPTGLKFPSPIEFSSMTKALQFVCHVILMINCWLDWKSLGWQPSAVVVGGDQGSEIKVPSLMPKSARLTERFIQV
jgi:hypothetical protein